MSDFNKISAALTTMGIDPPKRPSPRTSSSSGAPLDDVDQHGYAVPKDNVGRDNGSLPPRAPPPGVPPPPRPTPGGEYAQPLEHKDDRRHRPKHRERREMIAMQQGETKDQ